MSSAGLLGCFLLNGLGFGVWVLCSTELQKKDYPCGLNHQNRVLLSILVEVYPGGAHGNSTGDYSWPYAGLLSNQGEKHINFYFIMVPLRKRYKLVFHSGSFKKKYKL